MFDISHIGNIKINDQQRIIKGCLDLFRVYFHGVFSTAQYSMTINDVKSMYIEYETRLMKIGEFMVMTSEQQSMLSECIHKLKVYFHSIFNDTQSSVTITGVQQMYRDYETLLMEKINNSGNQVYSDSIMEERKNRAIKNK